MTINMLDMQGGAFDGLLSFSEAAEIWKVDESTLRKAVANGRLKEGHDCRKFGKQWVVTVKAMAREFRGGLSPYSVFLVNLRKARKAEEERTCENCKYSDECPNEWRDEQGGYCENYEQAE